MTGPGGRASRTGSPCPGWSPRTRRPQRPCRTNRSTTVQRAFVCLPAAQRPAAAVASAARVSCSAGCSVVRRLAWICCSWACTIWVRRAAGIKVLVHGHPGSGQVGRAASHWRDSRARREFSSRLEVLAQEIGLFRRQQMASGWSMRLTRSRSWASSRTAVQPRSPQDCHQRHSVGLPRWGRARAGPRPPGRPRRDGGWRVAGPRR